MDHQCVGGGLVMFKQLHFFARRDEIQNTLFIIPHPTLRPLLDEALWQICFAACTPSGSLCCARFPRPRWTGLPLALARGFALTCGFPFALTFALAPCFGQHTLDRKHIWESGR